MRYCIRADRRTEEDLAGGRSDCDTLAEPCLADERGELDEGVVSFLFGNSPQQSAPHKEGLWVCGVSSAGFAADCH